MLEQILGSLVGFLGRSEAGKLAHGKKLAAITSSVDATRKRNLSGMAEVLIVIPVFGQVSLGVKAADGHARDGRKTRVPALIQIGAGGGADRPLRGLLQCRAQCSFCPIFLTC